MSFQKTLNGDLPIAVMGDFASTNPRASMLAGEGELKTAEDITVGHFAFADTETGLVYAEHQDGYRVGFVHRNNQASVPIGESASMVVPKGRETALFTTGDFYTVFDADVVAEDPVFALHADGKPVTTDGADPDADPTPVPANASATGFIVAKGGAAGQLIKITRLG